MNNKGVKVIAFTGEELDMDNVLISGVVTNDEGESPMSIYSGTLDLSEIHNAIYYANRAVLKMMIDDFGIALSDCEDFLYSALSEACVSEYNARNSGKGDVEVKKIVKAVRRNQN